MIRPLLILLASIPFILSAQVDNYSSGLNGQKMDWLLYYLQEHYVEKVNNDSLTDLAIKRIVQELDPYSSYQTKEEAEEQQNSDKGYSGKAAGFNFYMLRDTAIVTYVSGDGPAAAAGLIRGDQIIEMAGQSIIGDKLQALRDVINDKEAEDINLTILRSGSTKKISYTKDLIPWKSITAGYMLTDRVGYIKLGKFTLKTMEEFVPTLNYLRSLGMQELVIDLRGNSGGVLSQALELANQFLQEGQLIYYEEGLNREYKEYKADGKGGWIRGKVVLIQDAYTASASEIFIGALQDWDRAVVLGVSTFGKGLIQQSYKLGDGSNIRLTVGKYCTPSGRYLQRAEGVNNNDWMTPYKQELSANALTSKLSVTENLKGKSKSGRYLVTGPGGIVPDVYYEWIDNQDWTLFNDLNNNGHMYHFTTEYVYKHREEMMGEYKSVPQFNDDRIREAFMLKDLRNYLESQNLSYELPKNFPDNIIYQIKAWIASQLWHDNAFHEMDNMDDRIIWRAREINEGRVHDMLGITY